LWSTDSTVKVGWFTVLNATFNNFSVISWRSVLLVEKTGVLGESHRPVASHWQNLTWAGYELTILVVIGTDCAGSCKSNYHTITTSLIQQIKTCWSINNNFRFLYIPSGISVLLQSYLGYAVLFSGQLPFSVVWKCLL
jgi:hypothetical protein